MTSGHTILVAEHLDQECLDWLAERAHVVVSRPDEPTFAPTLAVADALIVRTYVRVTPSLLAAAPRLRVVGRAGVGLDNVDLPACAGRGIRVVNTPGANTQAVVEFVVATIFDHIRPRETLAHALPPGQWERLRAAQLADRQLSEMTLGILGLGRIGSGLARVAGVLGARVIYHDLVTIGPDAQHGATPVPLSQLLREADIFSIHVDGRPSNRHLIDAATLAGLNPRCLLINTSRGLVIDTTALAAWLRAHPEASATLDVHDPEPFAGDYPLLGLGNCRLTAHLASGTRTAKRNMSWVVRDVWEALTGAL